MIEEAASALQMDEKADVHLGVKRQAVATLHKKVNVI
jgi:hypothetical protein